MPNKKCFLKILVLSQNGKKIKQILLFNKKNGKYGQSGVNDKILNDIIKSRISLYKKWYGNFIKI